MVFFGTIILFRIALHVVVFLAFLLFKKDPFKNINLNNIVSYIVTGSFGVTALAMFQDQSYYVVRYDELSTFILVSKTLLFSAAVGSGWMFILYPAIFLLYGSISERIEHVFKINREIAMDLLITISLYTLANASTIALIFSFIERAK